MGPHLQPRKRRRTSLVRSVRSAARSLGPRRRERRAASVPRGFGKRERHGVGTRAAAERRSLVHAVGFVRRAARCDEKFFVGSFDALPLDVGVEKAMYVVDVTSAVDASRSSITFKLYTDSLVRMYFGG